MFPFQAPLHLQMGTDSPVGHGAAPQMWPGVLHHQFLASCVWRSSLIGALNSHQVAWGSSSALSMQLWGRLGLVPSGDPEGEQCGPGLQARVERRGSPCAAQAVVLRDTARRPCPPACPLGPRSSAGPRPLPPTLPHMTCLLASSEGSITQQPHGVLPELWPLASQSQRFGVWPGPLPEGLQTLPRSQRATGARQTRP
jgi:hypothetical protein